MTEKEFRHIVRIANTDLDGNKPILHSLRRIKGVGFMFANAVCTKAAIAGTRKTGELTDQEISKLSEVVENPLKFNLPKWLMNRVRDPVDGTTKHLITGNLIFSHENDIKMLKKMRCYRGLRHIAGQPCRGQCTKSHFRKNKGKVSLGVKKREGVKSGRM